MSLVGERYDDAKPLFVAALERPPVEREDFVRARCADDQELLELVLRLVRAHGVDETSPGTDLASVDPTVFDVPGHRLLRVIGSGAAGIVFVAERLDTGAAVAVKLLRPELVSATSSVRAKREARILARLDHPGIARLLESGDASTPWGSRPYSALELVEGESLRSWWQRVSLPERFAMLADVCDAVQAAHDVGVVHRDLKPSNVLVDASGRSKVLDFGIGKLLDEPSTTISGGTRSGELVGTLAYASPEQVAGRRAAIGPAVDVFSLGAILFEMVAGRPPHDLDRLSILDAVRTVATEDPPRLRKLVPGLSPAVDAVCARAVARRPQARYPTVRALGDDLRRLADGVVPNARAAIARRRRTLAAAAALMLAGAVVAAAISWGPIAVAYAAEDTSAARGCPCPEPVPEVWLREPASWLPTGERADGFWVDEVRWIESARQVRLDSADPRLWLRPMPVPPLAIAAQAWRLGELDRAIAEYEQAAQRQPSAEPVGRPGRLRRGVRAATELVQVRLAYLLMFAGAADRAEVILRDVVGDEETRTRPAGPGAQKLALNLAHHARALAACGRHVEAQARVEAALAVRDLESGSYVVAEVELAAAVVAWARGNRDAARAHAGEAQRILDALVVPDHPLAQRAADLVARLGG